MPDPPNILVIMSDQHSRHALGCYGNGIVRTPNLDRLAAEGMRFTDAYCPAPLCVPSRMSFMTSRYPWRTQAWDNCHALSSGIPTWAHVLGTAGYETALLGRMHFVGPDQLHGFEQRPVGDIVPYTPGVPPPGGPMWTRFPAATSGQSRPAAEIAGRGPTHYQWYDQEVTRVSLDFLKRWARGKRERPLAAVIGYVMPHCPYIAPKELFDYYYAHVDLPPVEAAQPPSTTRFRERRDILEPPLSDERVRVARAAYFGLCEYIDGLIGRVLDCLAATGLADDTLVVYTSDHGDMAGEHGCWWKSCYFEGSAGVPLLARLPGVTGAGTVSPAVCNLTDLGVTFADLAGAAFAPTPDGHSLWPILQGQTPVNRPDETFSEFTDARDDGAPSRMIRSGPWKLWKVYPQNVDVPPALFHLGEDPGETRDLAAVPEHAAVRDALLVRLQQGWDPDAVRRASAEGRQAAETIGAWGLAVRPPTPPAVVLPPASYEDDVELL